MDSMGALYAHFKIRIVTNPEFEFPTQSQPTIFLMLARFLNRHPVLLYSYYTYVVCIWYSVGIARLCISHYMDLQQSIGVCR